MPGPGVDNLPSFTKGQPLLAADLEKIVAALRQQVLLPGSFRTGSFSVQRPIGVPGGATTETIEFQKCRVTEEITPRKIEDGELVNGTGRVIDVDEDDLDIGEEDRPVTNRDAWYYPVNAGVWCIGSRVNHGNCFADEWPDPPEEDP